MSDKPTLTEQAVDFGKGLGEGAMSGSVPALVMFFTVIIALLIAWAIKHRPTARGGSSPRTDPRILAELQSIRDNQAETKAAITRLHERIDKADEKFISRGEFAAFMKSFEHFEAEIRLIVETSMKNMAKGNV